MSYKYVFDASAMIALLKAEKGHEQLAGLVAGACMCVVNLSEVIAHFVQGGASPEEAQGNTQKLAIDYMSADEALSVEAGVLRGVTSRAGLSMGDRYCLALAKSENATAVTADQRWRLLPESVGVKIQFFRSHDE